MTTSLQMLAREIDKLTVIAQGSIRSPRRAEVVLTAQLTWVFILPGCQGPLTVESLHQYLVDTVQHAKLPGSSVRRALIVSCQQAFGDAIVPAIREALADTGIAGVLSDLSEALVEAHTRKTQQAVTETFDALDVQGLAIQ